MPNPDGVVPAIFAGSENPILSLIHQLRGAVVELVQHGDSFTEGDADRLEAAVVPFLLELNRHVTIVRRLTAVETEVIDLARQRSARFADGPSPRHDPAQLKIWGGN